MSFTFATSNVLFRCCNEKCLKDKTKPTAIHRPCICSYSFHDRSCIVGEASKQVPSVISSFKRGDRRRLPCCGVDFHPLKLNLLVSARGLIGEDVLDSKAHSPGASVVVVSKNDDVCDMSMPMLAAGERSKCVRAFVRACFVYLSVGLRNLGDGRHSMVRRWWFP